MKKYVRYAVLAVLLLLAGCSGKEQADGYKVIVDDYAAIILQRDLDSADYDNALAVVGTYMEKQNDAALQSARTLLGDTILRMEEASEGITSYQMKEDFSKLLQEHGIESEEYMWNADERKQTLEDYMITMKALDEYLSYEEDHSLMDQSLAMQYEMAVKVQNIMRSYEYCGINYWFAGWEEEKQEYIRQEVYEKLLSFDAPEETWQDDRDAVEERMGIYLNELEELYQEWANYLGEYQDELYQLERDIQ